MHHQIENLQAYIEEYDYRFNRIVMTDGIFDNVLKRMMEVARVTHKQLMC